MVIQPRIPDLKLPFICPWHNKEEVLSLPPSYGGVSGFFEGEIPCAGSNELDVYLLAIRIDLTSGSPFLEKLKCGKKIINSPDSNSKAVLDKLTQLMAEQKAKTKGDSVEHPKP